MSSVVAVFMGPFIAMAYLNKGRLALLYVFALITLHVVLEMIPSFAWEEEAIFNVEGIAYWAVTVLAAVHAYYVAKKFNVDEKVKWFARCTIPLIVLAVCLPFIAILFRTAVYEPFHIPSRSMAPTLYPYDTLLAEKFAYGYGAYSLPLHLKLWDGKFFEAPPNRGDIVIFALPSNTDIFYIKRIVGLPHDRILMDGGELYINDQRVPRKETGNVITLNGLALTEYQETLPNGVHYNILSEGDGGTLDNTGEYVVPKGHYFVMGDNRDHSHDSRVLPKIGFIPSVNIIGRAGLLIKEGQTGQYVLRAIE